MELVRHNTLGIGQVVDKVDISGFTFLDVRFENGKVMRFGIPQSFDTGALEALGGLKDEVEQAVAERNARLAAAAATAATRSKPAKKATAGTMPSGPIPSAFEKYLIDEGYAVETSSGNPSTVYSYVNAVESIRADEGVSWDTLKNEIATILPQYDVGGAKELIGAKSNMTYINALKRFAEFLGKP